MAHNLKLDMDILEEIIAHKRREVEQFKQMLSERELHRRAEQKMRETAVVPSMRRGLLVSETGIIAEFKRKSPSKGWIAEQAQAGQVPLDYQQNGAAALSILTDSRFFGGSDDFIVQARKSGVTLPVLYKNFIVDEYQLFQAQLCGASAVLLIAAVLTLKECKSLIAVAHELKMEVLLEMHREEELGYAETDADMFGVNNRNLGSFVTNVENSFRMASRLPGDACLVSESGISDYTVVSDLRQAGYSGFLIGEYFMKTGKPGECLRDFISHLT